jgi:ATP-dependent exoDNAse (exonuclease V) alpha subunit
MGVRDYTNLLLRHISIRVPWHDNKWNGTVCNFPKLNGSCLKLDRIAENRDDEAEDKVAGKSIEELEQNEWPCCVAERAMFMAPFAYTRMATHPYSRNFSETHAHFTPTPLYHPPYSAPAVPFLWMLRENLETYGEKYGLNVDPSWEPDLKFNTDWIQDKRNQQALLDCFFNHINPEKSLCFFYAKQVPFVEDFGRVLIGVGFVKNIGGLTEYEYEYEGELKSVLWERLVQHSIRPDNENGFLLPYQELIEIGKENPDLELSEFAALAPNDRIPEFSFASEHVTNDAAISALLSCSASLEKMKQYVQGDWNNCINWIDKRLAELWKMRGPCPGLGAALCAFGIDLGTFIAREVENQIGENEDPWLIVDKMFKNPEKILPSNLASKIGKVLQKTWNQLPQKRLMLLKILSRFEIASDQASTIYVNEERKTANINCTDDDIISNPYLIYELTRHTETPISLATIDKGIFPESIILHKHPLPEPTAVNESVDDRRVRAYTINMLENNAEQGHTLVPRSKVVESIRAEKIQPECPVTGDVMSVVEASFDDEIKIVKLRDGDDAYQLHRLNKMGEIIRNAVLKRLSGKRYSIKEDWRKLLDKFLNKPVIDEVEETAREEKVAALRELAESRISVLIGPAGTGKTTLLSVLCSQVDIAAGEVMLLAPTGKARVKMQQAAKNLKIKAYTLAQFLNKCDRYDGSLQRYILSDSPPVSDAETVIVDEASMLTEEMLAALIDGIKGVKRLILVGDPRQLPPIGPGRPFVDIVKKLSPVNIDYIFPKVGPGYAELTVRMRQRAADGMVREDIQLAEWFSGRPIPPGEDDIFNKLARNESIDHIKFFNWETPDEFRELLLDVLCEELHLDIKDDFKGFNLSLGGVESRGFVYFNRGQSGEKIERWQILSPVKRLTHGVYEINRFIHKVFKGQTITFARQPDFKRKIPKPMGDEQIVYGDKVINIKNHSRYNVYPKDDSECYIANGEIGIAVGQFKNKFIKKAPGVLKIEFSSQPGFEYGYTKKRDFDAERGAILELAYALTVHKAQGSEFGIVIFVMPNPCRLLSRELLYTALTRQQNRIVVLHQGNRGEIKKYSSDAFSETAKRLTNLFEEPKPIEYENKFLEDGLINITSDGTLVRSKSEVIIYNCLLTKGIKPIYEKPLKIGVVVRYPDFTVEDEETGNIYYWEHCGMMYDPSYKKRWEEKLNWYRENNILPYTEGRGEGGTLIITNDSKKGGISSQEIDAIIDKQILNR